ncbi:MAG: VWA domain-containing protein [Thermoplasmata archaeon]|nr:MAG: VWA domain-containing protein [Thermoplasmata archaeon]
MAIFLLFGGLFSFISLFVPESLPNAGGTIRNIFFDDMEAGGHANQGNWTTFDIIAMMPPQQSASRWELGVPAPPPDAYSPTNCWGTELSGAYATPTEYLLITPIIDLTSEAIKSAQLSFWHIYSFASGDGGWVEINSSSTFRGDLIHPNGGYTGLVNSIMGANPGYNGTIMSWNPASFDISAYIGRTFQIGFRFCGLMGDMFSRGWYIDDVKIDVEWLDSPLIGPDQTGIGLAGETLSYTLNIVNYNLVPDYIDIHYIDTEGWNVQVLNATKLQPLEDNGGIFGLPDVFLYPEESIDIVVNITIPLGVIEWDVSDFTTIYATSFNNSNYDTAELVTKTPFPDVGVVSLNMPSIGGVGNTVVVDAVVKNHGDWTVSFDVEGVISAMLINPPSTMEPSIQMISDLAPGETANLQWTFIPTVACDYTFTVTSLLDIDQVISNNRSSKTISIKDMLWVDDMETGGDAASGLWASFETSGYSFPTQWELGTLFGLVGPRSAPSPINCWGTDLDSTYLEDTDCYLFTPAPSAFDLRGYSEIKLIFNHWWQIQDTPAGDNGYIVYSYDSDPISIPSIQGPVTQYIGVSPGWESEELDMSFLAGQPYVRFGWQLLEDIGGNKFEPNQWPGWYLDDVMVWAMYARPMLIITEVVDSGGDEYIEVYNAGTLPADVSDYDITLDWGSSYLTSGTWNVGILPPNGHAYYRIPAGIDDLEDQGDTISIVNTSSSEGLINDQISYGQKGTVPDPIPGESVSRYWNITKYDDTWARDPTPTVGSQNDGPGQVATKYVVLNEVFFNPISPSDAFIEVMYVGDENDPDVDVDGWILVVGDSVFPIPPGAYSTQLNYANPFYVINASMIPGLFGTVDVNGDNVYLYTDSRLFVDEVGWSNPHDPDTSMSRYPDGFGVPLHGKPFGLMGYDDQSSISAGWVFNRPPTIPHILAFPDQTKWNFPGEYVKFNLTIRNLQGEGDLIEIIGTSTAGWLIEIYDAQGIILLSDSDLDGSPDIWVNGNEALNISVWIYIPEDFPIPDEDDITIYIQSDNDVFVGDFAFLNVKVYPHLEPLKSIAPSSIYVEGTGYGEQATITLEVTGAGLAIPGQRSNAADIVFVIDDTGSMGDVIDELKQAVNELVDRLEENISSLRLGLVSFKDFPEIDIDQDLTFDMDAFKSALNALEAIGGADGQEDADYALETAANLSWRTDTNVTKIMILITDYDTHDNLHLTNVAKWAYEKKGIHTNTIGIPHIFGSPPGYYVLPEAEYWLKRTAENGSGYYREYGLMDDLVDIILNGIMMIVPTVDLAGEDPDITDSNPMITDVLPPYISYVPGTFSIPPDNIYVNSENRTILQWNVSRLRIGDIWRTSFRITSSELGLVDTNEYFLSIIDYTRWDNSSKTNLFPRTQIFVKLPDPLPPKLFIDIVDDSGVPNGKGDNILLYWIPPSSPKIEYYLIYRSDDQRSFDFTTPWLRTDVSDDNGVIPLRTTWNDTRAAKIGDLNYSQEVYYTIRAVNVLGEMSSTSRTVGKWTKTFPQGVSTFSLPLKSLEAMNNTTDYYLNDMTARYIKWMDPAEHIWMKHGDGGVNDSHMVLGRGYECAFDSPTTYTFLGIPGAMISYDDDSGFFGFDKANEAKSLALSVEANGDVRLTWEEPGGMDSGDLYEVYYSNKRDGFFGILNVDYFPACAPVYYGNNTATHINAQANNPGTQLYYIVVPFNSTGVRGSSTYSMGIWMEGFQSQYDSIGIPLKLSSYPTVDWYCDNIPDTVGINYYIEGEQRWCWHSTRMPEGAYDPQMVMGEGYQISTTSATKFIYVGV